MRMAISLRLATKSFLPVTSCGIFALDGFAGRAVRDVGLIKMGADSYKEPPLRTQRSTNTSGYSKAIISAAPRRWVPIQADRVTCVRRVLEQHRRELASNRR